VAPEGQVDEHVGVAEKPCWVPSGNETEVGLTATEVRAMIVITVGELCFTTPLRVALTKIPTVPPVVPAVKVTEAPVPVIEPIVPLLNVHA
jgi:hypothetical protein